MAPSVCLQGLLCRILFWHFTLWPLLYFNNHVFSSMLSYVLHIKWKCKITFLNYSLSNNWEFAPCSFHVQFMVDHVALEQMLLQFLRFPVSLTFHPGSPYPQQLGHKQYARWWPQFREIVSTHRLQQKIHDYDNHFGDVVIIKADPSGRAV
jgi:hypothetical protein